MLNKKNITIILIIILLVTILLLFNSYFQKKTEAETYKDRILNHAYNDGLHDSIIMLNRMIDQWDDTTDDKLIRMLTSASEKLYISYVMFNTVRYNNGCACYIGNLFKEYMLALKAIAASDETSLDQLKRIHEDLTHLYESIDVEVLKNEDMEVVKRAWKESISDLEYQPVTEIYYDKWSELKND